jgi:acyl-CoA reductase-like NAD-dependent aldehyde dehydrogenase
VHPNHPARNLRAGRHIRGFDDENDAIERANATEFGLAAGVFTRDVDRARRVSRQINAGTVWTNTWFAINNGFEEGGYRQSGLGRLRGARGLLRPKLVNLGHELGTTLT